MYTLCRQVSGSVASRRCTREPHATVPDKVVGADAVHDTIELISIEQHRAAKRNRKSRCRAQNRANAGHPESIARY